MGFRKLYVCIVYQKIKKYMYSLFIHTCVYVCMYVYIYVCMYTRTMCVFEYDDFTTDVHGESSYIVLYVNKDHKSFCHNVNV